MSEYQFYEFRSLDRELADGEIDALESISTRAQVTPTSFTNHYDWGDLLHGPAETFGTCCPHTEVRAPLPGFIETPRLKPFLPFAGAPTRPFAPSPFPAL